MLQVSFMGGKPAFIRVADVARVRVDYGKNALLWLVK